MCISFPDLFYPVYIFETLVLEGVVSMSDPLKSIIDTLKKGENPRPPASANKSNGICSTTYGLRPVTEGTDSITKKKPKNK